MPPVPRPRIYEQDCRKAVLLHVLTLYLALLSSPQTTRSGLSYVGQYQKGKCYLFANLLL
jgi:hypothetical protein